MDKDINKTLSMLVPVLNQTGERIESIEAVKNWYKAEDYEGVTREYMKEVAEITLENGVKKYADIGSDSNLAAIYDITAVLLQIKPQSTAIDRIERGVYE